jgi:hypothetical protein
MDRLSSLTDHADHLEGAAFEDFQRSLAAYNARRLDPSTGSTLWKEDLCTEGEFALAESLYIEAVREKVAPLLADVPDDPVALNAGDDDKENKSPRPGDKRITLL